MNPEFEFEVLALIVTPLVAVLVATLISGNKELHEKDT